MTSTTYFHEGYRIASAYPLTRPSIDKLIACFESPGSEASLQLGGRWTVSRIHLDSIGPVIVKMFRRGGLLARWVKKSYLRIGKTRAQIEFEQLQAVKKIGVQAPQPVAFACKGSLFYRNWLVTLEIPCVQSMAQLSRTTPQLVPAALHSLCRQVDLLINEGILHADFHPGNVLVDDRDNVYLIDFDKAGVCRRSRAWLTEAYRRRWCRAVRKHGLPQTLCTNMNLTGS